MRSERLKDQLILTDPIILTYVSGNIVTGRHVLVLSILIRYAKKMLICISRLDVEREWSFKCDRNLPGIDFVKINCRRSRWTLMTPKLPFF
jgi:hypothetical protein